MVMKGMSQDRNLIFSNNSQNKCRLYGDKDETINRIISESSKLASVGTTG